MKTVTGKSVKSIKRANDKTRRIGTGHRINRKLKRIAALVLIFGMIVSLGCFFSTKAAKAAEQSETNKYYTSVLIEEGDTLNEIASRYISPECGNRDEYVLEIRNINHIIGDEIHAGCYIVIPYYSTDNKI